jgi:2-polyprenyl-3-methyl-5-hydroxy-6-metoxy-1,4-benzoquinol methylase
MNRTRGEHSIKGLVQRSKYEFARRFCYDKRVLDLGCGTGFGTELLAEVARAAVGCDVKECKQTEARDGTAYYDADVTRPIPWLENDFDVVVSMDVIEHLPTPSGLLENAAQAMRAGGIFILATPNVTRTHGTNPHHVHEYSYQELRSLLLAYFDSVVILGLEKNDKSWCVRWLRDHSLDFTVVRRLLRVPLFEELTTDDYPITGDLDRAYAFVAVCRTPL